jgi:hypothetical protein
MLVLPSERLAVIERAEAVQQSGLAQAYGAAIGRPVAVGESGSGVASTQAAMAAARAGRLRNEIVLRTLLALVFASIPTAILWRKRGRTVAWLLGGALLYAALFNLRYAVLSGRTYSLSSIASANELIFFCALTAAAALILSWLVAAIGLRFRRRGPREAAELTLAFVLTTICLLSLPILFSFALDGLLVGWTLPDFLSMFLGFLSGLQVLFVALIGAVLAGLAAAVASVLERV